VSACNVMQTGSNIDSFSFVVVVGPIHGEEQKLRRKIRNSLQKIEFAKLPELTQLSFLYAKRDKIIEIHI
jgi:hypothetical protein